MKIEINIDDKLIERVRRFFSRRNVIVMFAIIFMTSMALFAADLRLNIFKPKTVILSSEINDNFETLHKLIDDNFETINKLVGDNFSLLSSLCNSNTPPGTIIAYAGQPSSQWLQTNGWLVCDGREVSRQEYQELFNAIRTSWGAGNSSTTFNLPDLRGRFLRGVNGEARNNIPNVFDDPNAYVDPDYGDRKRLYPGGNEGNSVGSYQGDAIRNIKGEFDGTLGTAYNAPPFQRQFSTGNLEIGHPDYGYYDYVDYYCHSFDASSVVPTASDNRPKNAYVNYLIKVK